VTLGKEVHIQLQLSAYRVRYGPGAQVIDICTGFESTPVIVSKVTDNIQDDQLHALSSLFDHCQLLQRDSQIGKATFQFDTQCVSWMVIHFKVTANLQDLTSQSLESMENSIAPYTSRSPLNRRLQPPLRE